jgi:hypothetical protein
MPVVSNVSRGVTVEENTRQMERNTQKKEKKTTDIRDSRGRHAALEAAVAPLPWGCPKTAKKCPPQNLSKIPPKSALNVWSCFLSLSLSF